MNDIQVTFELAKWGINNVTATPNNCAILYNKLLETYPCASNGTCYNPDHMMLYAIVAGVLIVASFFCGAYYSKRVWETHKTQTRVIVVRGTHENTAHMEGKQKSNRRDKTSN